jgi:thioredoxin-dependent peroxiredoxin
VEGPTMRQTLWSIAVLMVLAAGCERKPDMAKQKEQERTGVVTFKGGALTLIGPEVKVGTKAPAFEVLTNDLQPASLDNWAGKVRLVSVVPSLDTAVCDTQTRKFNEAAAALGPDVVVLTISVDLPFAQARWCGAAGVERVTTLSDHRDASFGRAWGLLIKELRLLARVVYVVDQDGVVRYGQIVPEVTTEPDYDAALAAARELL